MGARSITQSDIAHAAGVSRALVSMALAGSPRVASDTKAKIFEVATQLGYARDMSAASLASSSSEIIGVLLPNLINPFFESLVESIQNRADTDHLLPLLATASNDEARERQVMQRFRELRVRGIITVSPAVSPAELREYGRSTPLVALGESKVGGHVDTVCMDEQDAAKQIMRHLRQRGCRQVAYIYDPHLQHDRGLERRCAALVSAAHKAHIDLDPRETDNGIAEVVADLLGGGRGRLTIIGHNDLLATEITSAVRAEGLSTGRDVGVIGYDDTHLAQRSEINLTSVAQGTDEQARRALAMIEERDLGRNREGQNIVVPVRLVVRSSG